MTIDSATAYADSIAQQITERTKAGYPFGVRHEDSDTVYADMDEAREEHGDEFIEDEFTSASGYDYLLNVLDVQFTVGSDRQYRSGRILIAFGGPTAWIDTRTGQVEAAWWSAPVTRDLPQAFIGGLDDALEEYFELS